MKVDETIDKINKICLSGCEGVDCGDILYYHLINYNNSFSFFIKNIIRLFVASISYNMVFKIKGNPKTLFLFPYSSRDRNDLYQNFLKVVNLFSSYVIGTTEKRKLRLKNIRILFLSFSWQKNINSIIKDYKLSLFCALGIALAYNDYYSFLTFEKKNKINLDGLICTCDVHLTESFFASKFRNALKTTVTLQHGCFTSTINQWAIEKSKSAYFLANSNFTKNESKKLTYNNKMIVVGPFSMIDSEKISERPLYSIKTFTNIGLFLDGEICHDDNIKIVLIFKNVCRECNKRLLIKIHPNSKISDYEAYLSDFKNYEIYDKNISLLDFSKKIDIAISRNSTTILETIYLNIPSYIFEEDNQYMKVFKNVDLYKIRNESEAKMIIGNQKQIINDLKDAKAYFCTGMNVTKNYIDAFKEIGVK